MVYLAIIRIRLSRIWRILQMKEGAIHQARRPWCITPPFIFRILHILRKPNSIIVLLFLRNNSKFKNRLKHANLGWHKCISITSKMFRRLFNHFVLTTKTTQPRRQVFTVKCSITCNKAALLTSFWRRRFNMTKFFPNLVNSSWLWWIMRVVLTIRNGEIFWMNNKIIYRFILG